MRLIFALVFMVLPLALAGFFLWLRPQPETPGAPLFEAHYKVCPECRREPDEDGPAPLCEEGFRLFQEDLRRAQQREEEQNRAAQQSGVGVPMYIITNQPHWLAL